MSKEKLLLSRKTKHFKNETNNMQLITHTLHWCTIVAYCKVAIVCLHIQFNTNCNYLLTIPMVIKKKICIMLYFTVTQFNCIPGKYRKKTLVLSNVIFHSLSYYKHQQIQFKKKNAILHKSVFLNNHYNHSFTLSSISTDMWRCNVVLSNYFNDNLLQ